MDSSLFEWINRLAGRTSWAHGTMAFFANDGVVLFAMLLLMGFLVARQRRDTKGMAAAVWAGGAALVALGVGQIIGNAADRARPYSALSGVRVLVDRTTDFSFPSDHATVVGAVAVGLWFVDRRVGIVTTVAAVFMAFTRVYVGAHYPLDVVAGLLLGGSVAALGQRLAVPWLRRLLDAVGRSPLRRVVTPPPGG